MLKFNIMAIPLVSGNSFVSNLVIWDKKVTNCATTRWTGTKSPPHLKIFVLQR